jgi:hypothetical protein
MSVANPPLEDAIPATGTTVAAPITASTTGMISAPVVTLIRPAQGWQLINFGELLKAHITARLIVR